jgi:hypothetical protein
MIETERMPEQEQNLEVAIEDSRQIKKELTGTVVLARNKRCWVFVFIIFVNIFINFDHGYFPAATEEFKRDFHIDESMLGIFGSAVYLGNLIGK